MQRNNISSIDPRSISKSRSRRSGSISATKAWKHFRALDVEKAPGSSTDAFDGIVAPDGRPFVLPFAERGNRMAYSRRSLVKIIRHVLKARRKEMDT